MRLHPVIGAVLLAGAWCISPLFAQAIEFESNGLRYQTLTRSGVTVMFAPLPTNLHQYVVLQLAVSNGSPSNRTVKPEDFKFVAADGTETPAVAPRTVVQRFLDKGNRDDVVKLVGTYEVSLYGLSRFQSTNGYEQRRQAAQAEFGSARFRAAAAASAIVFVQTRLPAGSSTDGAIFFPIRSHPFPEGKLVATIGLERFEFEIGGLRHPGELTRRP